MNFDYSELTKFVDKTNAIAEAQAVEIERRYQAIENSLLETSETLQEVSKLLRQEQEERIQEQKSLKRQNSVSLGIAIASAITSLIAAGFQISDFFIN